MRRAWLFSWSPFGGRRIVGRSSVDRSVAASNDLATQRTTRSIRPLGARSGVFGIGNARFATQGFGDLDQLSLAGSKVPNRYFGRKVAPNQIRQSPRLAVRRVPVNESERSQDFGAKENVLRNAEIRDQCEVLVDDADPRSHRISRAHEVDRTVQQCDLACVGRIKTGNNLDQRAFACPIRSKQSMDFARHNVEIDSVERHNARKGFSQTANAENIVSRAELSACRRRVDVRDHTQIGGFRSRQGISFSNTELNDRSVASPPKRPTSCTPIGSPSGDQWRGKDIAG